MPSLPRLTKRPGIPGLLATRRSKRIATLGEMVKKLYAYRGDEPGVSHGAAEVPDVDSQDAQFVVNLAAVVGLYLREKLSS